MMRRASSGPVQILLMLAACGAVPVQGEELAIARGERLLVIAPHPDDETLGAGGVIQRVRRRGGTIRIVVVTAGDGYVEAVVMETGNPRPRPAQYVAYGEQRMREARAAARQLAPTQARVQFLGFPDGALAGLLWAHWWRRNPEESRTTERSRPPYGGLANADLAYDGDDLRRELERIVAEVSPTLVVFPDPLDKHPDHRAAGVFTLLAVDSWARTKRVPAKRYPRLMAYLVHWPGWPPGWDAAVPEYTDGPLDLPVDFRPPTTAFASLRLIDVETATKRAALDKHVTQQEVMGSLLAAFVRRTEPFTVFTPGDARRAEELVPRHPPK